MGIIDLIQFPHQGRKTGTLTVSQEGKLLATLYYNQGNLIHGESEHAKGIEAIVGLVDLEDGEFLFDNNDTAGRENNIEMDLHHAILEALRLRDERKSEENETTQEVSAMPSHTNKVLSAMLERASWMNYVCVLGQDAELVAELFGPQAGSHTTEQYEPMRASIIGFLRSYPEQGVGKLVIDQDDGMVMVQRLANGHLLLVVCGPNAVMGAMVAAVSKAVNALSEEGEAI